MIARRAAMLARRILKIRSLPGSVTAIKRFELLRMTSIKFSIENMVGRGGYAEVYKRILLMANVSLLRLKRLAKGKPSEHTEKEFLTELRIQGHVCHPNIAYLLGCCIENGLCLVFKFCANGTLASALHGRSGKILEWPLRYKIAVGVARGLRYLHMFCKHRIIHRDIKASNVLLGDDYEPQISDFGLAKWLPKAVDSSLIPIEGTFGYLAPEDSDVIIIRQFQDMKTRKMNLPRSRD